MKLKKALINARGIQGGQQGPRSGRASSAPLSFKRRAFTLAEILIAVVLTGLIASLAFAPVVYAVNRIIETETAYTDETALRQAAVFMAHDAAAGLRLAPTVVRIAEHRDLSEGDDYALIVASSSPAKQNLAAGSVVYRIVRRSIMDDDIIPGLYRWLLPGILPTSADHERLEENDGQLVLPYVTELKLSVLKQPDWDDKEYSGALPQGMKFELARGEERVEYVFAFPQ